MCSFRPKRTRRLATQAIRFNPLQSKKEATVGEFYFKKGDYRAAAGRFSEATNITTAMRTPGCGWATPRKR